MTFLTWLGGLFKGSSKSVVVTSVPTNQASLPSLPVGSIAAVADALTQAGRLAEQQVVLHNTPAMQQAKMTAQDEAVKEKIENDIKNQNLNAIRTDLAG